MIIVEEPGILIVHTPQLTPLQRRRPVGETVRRPVLRAENTLVAHARDRASPRAFDPESIPGLALQPDAAWQVCPRHAGNVAPLGATTDDGHGAHNRCCAGDLAIATDERRNTAPCAHEQPGLRRMVMLATAALDMRQPMAWAPAVVTAMMPPQSCSCTV
jgi:hypothetical protein